MTYTAFAQSLIEQRTDLTAKLAPAQVRVLQGLLAGSTETEIAAEIGRSRHTVHDHTKAIYGRLNVRNRCELVLRFVNLSAP